MAWGPQSAHIEPQVWFLLFSGWRLTYLSPALTLLPWLALGWILVSTHCALAPQRLTLIVPLPCSHFKSNFKSRAVLTCFSWSRVLDLSFAPPHLPFQCPVPFFFFLQAETVVGHTMSEFLF